MILPHTRAKTASWYDRIWGHSYRNIRLWGRNIAAWETRTWPCTCRS